jgi:signal transduction histidine kinase
MNNFLRSLSLSKQFLMVSFPILLAATLTIGWWVGQQVEDSVVHRIGGVTALYVDSFVAPHVQTLVKADELSGRDQASIAADLTNTPLGKKIVSLKIWRKDGYVLFSTDKEAMGKKFPIEEGLAVAQTGDIFSEISVRTDAQQATHGQPMPRLIETYTPIHADRTGEVLAVAEFYQRPDEVDREVVAAQQRSWLLVAGTTLTMYLMLFLLVSKGSKTIESQQSELGDKVTQLTVLNNENTKLQARVILAAERATELNETFLQRISADIHDGPGQDLGFALMQLKNIDDRLTTDVVHPQTEWLNNIEPARMAVQSALKDLRAISSNLELPDIEALDPSGIAARVVRDFQAKTGASVTLEAMLPARRVSFRIKVTLYRLLQESLANAFRHAQCKECRVVLKGHADSLVVEISDRGPGFDPIAAVKKGRLGLQGMRQRVEVLGGTFEIHSVIGVGTIIHVSLPLTTSELPHA